MTSAHQVWSGVPETEILSPGHLSCPGCGAALAVRLALKVLGRRTVFTVPACCWAVCDGPFPYSATGVPLLHCAFETAASTAAGVRAGFAARGVDDILVVAWAGDGGTFDIGLQALSAAAERNDDFLYVCYDNEAYMNTGIQRSSATPALAWTTTTPPAAMPKVEPKKNLAEIVAAHRVPYFATAVVSYVDDYLAKFRRAVATKGFRMIHILSPCPPGWKCDEDLTVELARLAVQTRTFPLFEVEGGVRWRLTQDPPARPIEEFLKRQGRFAHLKPEQVASLQRRVDEEFEILSRRCRDYRAGSNAG